MSVIPTNSLGVSFPVAKGAFDLERSPGNALARSLAPIDLGGDTLHVGLPRLGPPFESPPASGPPSGGGFGDGIGGSGLAGGFGGIVAALMNELASLFAQLSQVMGLAWNANGDASQAGAPGQQAFANATASSTGDPHESFAGTRADGRGESGKWDSMTEHANLLSSDSFDGGYRISNTVTQPSANGVTMNKRVDVATDGGQTDVGMNADGTTEVTSFGRKIDLHEGRAVRLNENESVTLNADTSVTIEEKNANGGSIATTLRSNGGGGVDVSNEAHRVDLGGYLVTKTDGDTDPVPLASSAYAVNDPSGGYDFIRPIFSSLPQQNSFEPYRSPQASQVRYAAESFEPDAEG